MIGDQGKALRGAVVEGQAEQPVEMTGDGWTVPEQETQTQRCHRERLMPHVVKELPLQLARVVDFPVDEQDRVAVLAHGRLRTVLEQSVVLQCHPESGESGDVIRGRGARHANAAQLPGERRLDLLFREVGIPNSYQIRHAGRLL